MKEFVSLEAGMIVISFVHAIRHRIRSKTVSEVKFWEEL
jgi:hypothetical protein